MGVPVDELRASMSERTRREYEIHMACEPTIGERIDWWMSRILATIVNQKRKPDSAPVDPQKLIRDLWGDAAQVDVQTRRAKLRAMLRGAADKEA